MQCSYNPQSKTLIAAVHKVGSGFLKLYMPEPWQYVTYCYDGRIQLPPGPGEKIFYPNYQQGDLDHLDIQNIIMLYRDPLQRFFSWTCSHGINCMADIGIKETDPIVEQVTALLKYFEHSLSYDTEVMMFNKQFSHLLSILNCERFQIMHLSELNTYIGYDNGFRLKNYLDDPGPSTFNGLFQELKNDKYTNIVKDLYKNDYDWIHYNLQVGS